MFINSKSTGAINSYVVWLVVQPQKTNSFLFSSYSKKCIFTFTEFSWTFINNKRNCLIYHYENSCCYFIIVVARYTFLLLHQ